MPGEIAQAFVRVRANTTGFQREVKAGIAPGLKHAALGFAGISAGIFGLEKAGEILRDGIQSAAKVQKQIETVDQVFGESAESVRHWGEEVASTLGVTDDAALETAARIGILAKNLGIGQAKAAEMTLGFEQLAASIAQIRGTDPAIVFAKLPQILAGNTRSLKEMGFAFSQVQIKTKAVELGLITMKQQLTPAAKAQAIYALVTKDLAYYQKLAADHSDDLLNKQRSLSAEWEQAKQTLGESFLPVLSEFTGFLSNEMPKAVDDAKPYLDDLAGGLATVAAAAKFAAENIKAVIDISNGLTGSVFDKLKIPDEFKVFFKNGGLFNPLNQAKLLKDLRAGLGGAGGSGGGGQSADSPLSLGSNPRLAGAGVTPSLVDDLVKRSKDDLDKAKIGSGKIQRYQQLQLDLAAARRTDGEQDDLRVAKEIQAIFDHRVATTRLTGKALFDLKQQQQNALDLVDTIQDSINRDAQAAAEERQRKDQAAADKLAETKKRAKQKELAAFKKSNKEYQAEQIKLLKERFGPNVGKSKIQLDREAGGTGGGGKSATVSDFYNAAVSLFGQYGSNITSGFGGILSSQDAIGSLAGSSLAGTRAGRVRGITTPSTASTATASTAKGKAAFVDPLVSVTERVAVDQRRRDMAVLRELQKQTRQLARISSGKLGTAKDKANNAATHGTGG